jgi:DNA gyrase subunit A
MKGGIIAIKLDEGDRLIDVVKVAAGQDVVLSTAQGMSIRFCESDARAMGRNTMGVKGINLSKGDQVVGMVVAEEGATLLTACENGYGKRTPFGVGDAPEGDDESAESSVEGPVSSVETTVGPTAADDETDTGHSTLDTQPSSSMRYRRQKRGGKGLRDIKTTSRNGQVVGTLCVHDGDDVLMISSSGKIQRIRAADISTIGRNTQGVRIMSLDESDKLVQIARIPAEVADDDLT